MIIKRVVLWIVLRTSWFLGDIAFILTNTDCAYVKLIQFFYIPDHQNKHTDKMGNDFDNYTVTLDDKADRHADLPNL